MDRPTESNIPDTDDEERSSEKQKKPARMAYEMTVEGLTFGSDEPGGEKLLICDPFTVVARTHNGNGKHHAVLIEWTDCLEITHRFSIQMSLLSRMNELKSILADQGFNIFQAPGAGGLFATYMQKLRRTTVMTTVDREGWHGDVYVSASGIFPPAKAKEFLISNPGTQGPVTKTGTLKSWQKNVAAPAQGNSRLVLAISVAFAAPVARLVGAESGGFHLVGPSSIGKTTALRLAASVAGKPIATWRTTANGAEGSASEANDGLISLDELSQAMANDVKHMIYMIGNGVGKIRADKSGKAKDAARWLVLLLSTGEVGLEAKLNEAKQSAMPGEMARFSEIPSDPGAGHGIYETLNGYETGEALSRHFKNAVKENSGTALAAFLTEITRDVGAAKAKLEARKAQWLKENLPPDVDGQVSRTAQRFALIAAAGELAIEYEILPWSDGAAEAGVARCFTAWLERRGGSGALEITNAIDQVRDFLMRHGASRFPVDDGQFEPRDVANHAGWRRKSEDGWDYLCATSIFKKEICQGLESKSVANILMQKGLLIPHDGKPYKNVKIGKTAHRVYWIKGAVMGDQP